MTLTADLAPLAVSRVVELARTGFFDGMAIHRVVPGRIVQLGDPVGDGYGGSGKPPLPCETSPVPFAPLSVGMALSGRDTGSSQMFVTLDSQPELDGAYPFIGFADLEWREVREGEVIRKVVVKQGA
jgi:cyclophilin family peptidyl-prolyl cis-trans isomerase